MLQTDLNAVTTQGVYIGVAYHRERGDSIRLRGELTDDSGPALAAVLSTA
ncbi:Uncharacterised protein [Mycobacteroides abscessus subsp. abscessus]|nr:Uncharacterised protein [Mycobacteroides abscessus subsp. abscessus]